MRKITMFFILAFSISGCSEQICCSVSQRVMNDPMYTGQTELCYGDSDVSNRLDQDEWVEHMEYLGCNCY